jgi:hypothetical protein
MNDLTDNIVIPSMSDFHIQKVEHMENLALQLPQVDIKTTHFIHAGMYARTIMIPSGVMITGALIKIPTIIVVQGNVIIHTGGNNVELQGYNVLPAYANRKQAFVAKSDTYVTMIFSTNVESVEDAENEFTNDSEKLLSRSMRNVKDITYEGN